MKRHPIYGMIAAGAASLILAGCYTQFGSTQEDQPQDEVAYSESDTAEEVAVSEEGYDDARYRFYFSVGYPYWSPAFGIGFWDPYPYDPWLWGPPAYWYPYGAYYSPGWYYPSPVVYYPPGYWYGPPVAGYPPVPVSYANRTFGTARSYGSSRTGVGAYRPPTSTGLGISPGAVTGVRPASTRPGGTRSTPAVQGRRTASPSSVDRTASPTPAVRQGRSGNRSGSQQVRPSPEQRKPRSSGSGESVAPQSTTDRKSSGASRGSAVTPRPSSSGSSRSYSSPPSSAPSSHPSGSASGSRPSGGGSSAPRAGGRR
jgi:hypothetical protein